MFFGYVVNDDVAFWRPTAATRSFFSLLVLHAVQFTPFAACRAGSDRDKAAEWG